MDAKSFFGTITSGDETVNVDIELDTFFIVLQAFGNQVAQDQHSSFVKALIAAQRARDFAEPRIEEATKNKMVAEFASFLARSDDPNLENLPSEPTVQIDPDVIPDHVWGRLQNQISRRKKFWVWRRIERLSYGQIEDRWHKETGREISHSTVVNDFKYLRSKDLIDEDGF